MSAESKKKRGISGASNAKSIPYRYVGGSHEHPHLSDPAARQALKERAAPYKESAAYAQGMFGGVLAAMLGYERGFEDWRKMVAEAQQQKAAQ